MRKKMSLKSAQSSSRESTARRNTAAGRRLIQAADEMLAHARGEVALPMRIYHIPDTVDVKAVREKSGLSQSEFARKYGLNVRALQEWEQGRRAPEPAVRAYLLVIERNPGAVVRALHAAAAGI